MPLCSFAKYFSVSFLGFFKSFKLATIYSGLFSHMIKFRSELRFLTWHRASDSVTELTKKVTLTW